MKDSNIITLKLKYSTEKNNGDIILEYIKNYNNVLRFTYNRLLENNNEMTTKDCTALQKTMNNVFVDSHFMNSAMFEARSIISRSGKKPIIFGSKKLFLERQNNKITSEDYKLKRMAPLSSVGEALQKANRKFQIVSTGEILFKPSRKEHFMLLLESVGKNYKKYLEKLLLLQESKQIPITYKLSTDYIYLSFDLSKLEESLNYRKIENRIFAIDMNPNYIGYSIIDWKNSDEYKIIDSGVFSLKELNDYDSSLNGNGLSIESEERKYIVRKRHHEIVDISHKLCNIAKHYECEIFSMEGLKIESSDKQKGRKFNKLCNNQWQRGLFTNQINKICKLYKIKTLEVLANYSSFIGNLVYRQEKKPDMVLSSIEISRRGYEFYHQHILKDKKQEKNIVFNRIEVIKSRLEHSLEELGYDTDFKTIQELYSKIKKSGLRYRLLLKDLTGQVVFSKIHIKSYQAFYRFI